jgi:hypothetical protein
MQDGCKVYMDSYMASNGSCFMITWTILKNHLLEVGLTQNSGDHGIPNAWGVHCTKLVRIHVSAQEGPVLIWTLPYYVYIQ